METLKIYNRIKYFIYNVSQRNFGSKEMYYKICCLGCKKKNKKIHLSVYHNVLVKFKPVKSADCPKIIQAVIMRIN